MNPVTSHKTNPWRFNDSDRRSESTYSRRAALSRLAAATRGKSTAVRNGSRVIHLILLASIGAMTLTGCATNPVSGKANLVTMSEDQELALGRKVSAQIMQTYTPYDNPGLQEYVETLGNELAAKSHRSNLVYQFTVLDDPAVNAFAVPGGYIYITRGIMAYMQNEAQLAGVLGHEIGHVTARHSVRQQSTAQITGLLGAIAAAKTGSRGVADAATLMSRSFISGFGRSYELEADRLGAEYLARGGYDPDDMLDVVGILKDQEEFEKARAAAEGREPRAYHGVFASHPRNDDRLQEVIAAAKRLEGTGGTRGKDSEAFLARMDGVVFGPGESQGILRGQNFYHKDLNLYMQFPPGWRVENQPKNLVATSSDGAERIIVGIQDMNRRESPETFLRRLAPRLQQGEALRSVEGYAGVATMKTNSGSTTGRVAAVYERDKIYLLQAISKSGVPDRTGLITTANTIRPLRADENRLAEARRIRLYRARPGDTWAQLAQRSSINSYAEEQLRVMNGMFPDGEPEPGQLIKLVD